MISLGLIKTYPRLWTLEAGMAMVVTDLHGDWQVYQRYRDRFVALYEQNLADYLIFTGDLIHHESDNPAEDESVEILLDVLALRQTYGEAIIYLCGNHELPHIYGLTLSKGEREYTSRFETSLSQAQCRSEINDLFMSLPFFLRTKAGLSLTHAGAAACFTLGSQVQRLFNWNHQKLLAQADAILAADDIPALQEGFAKLHYNGIPYESLAKHFLAVTGPNDPRYNHLLRGFMIGSFTDFEHILWPALFTRCEQEYGLKNYAIFVQAFLQELSTDFYPQTCLLGGHINVQGGYEFITKQHLRLASGKHALPLPAGQYLIFDTSQTIQNPQALLAGLGSIY